MFEPDWFRNPLVSQAKPLTDRSTFLLSMYGLVLSVSLRCSLEEYRAKDDRSYGRRPTRSS